MEIINEPPILTRGETRVSRAFPLRAGSSMEIHVSEQQVVRRNIISLPVRAIHEFPVLEIVQSETIGIKRKKLRKL